MPQISDSQAAVRRRFRETTTRLERYGADEDTAQLVFSIVQHLEQPRQVLVGSHCEQRGQARVAHAERIALVAVLTLISRNLNERAAREQGLMETVCQT
jgi:hypothetical protein